MKVTLFDYTGFGHPDPARHAASVLIYTKSTRLQMSPTLLDDIYLKPETEMLAELKVMSNTNPGSWEFIHFSFLIEDCSRAFTQQLQRTRTASYAQQTWRNVDMTGFKYYTGPSINKLTKETYDSTMDYSAKAYAFLINAGTSPEDARGVLPMNALTNVNMCINMRNFINLCRKRSSRRVQNEHQQAKDLMLIEVQKVYPWFHIFYKNDEMQAYKDLSDMISDSKSLRPEEKTEMYKKLDIIKKDM